MSTGVRQSLRGRVAGKIADHNTHATLRDYCERFGLTGSDAEGSKRDRAAAAVEGMSDREIAVAAKSVKTTILMTGAGGVEAMKNANDVAKDCRPAR